MFSLGPYDFFGFDNISSFDFFAASLDFIDMSRQDRRKAVWEAKQAEGNTGDVIDALAWTLKILDFVALLRKPFARPSMGGYGFDGRSRCG